MNHVLQVPVCLAQYDMKDECIAQIPPGRYSGFNIPMFKINITMKNVIQRGIFNIPWPISYLQASFVSVFAERIENAEEESACSHNILKKICGFVF